MQFNLAPKTVKSLSVGLSAVLAFLSPGLGCYEALAQVRAFQTGPSQGGAAYLPGSRGPALGLPEARPDISGLGAFDLGTLGGAPSLGSPQGQALSSLEGPALSRAEAASRQRAPGALPDQARTLAERSGERRTADRTAKEGCCPRDLEAIQKDIGQIFDRAPDLGKATGDDASSYSEDLFGRLAGWKTPGLPSFALSALDVLPAPSAPVLNGIEARDFEIRITQGGSGSSEDGPPQAPRGSVAGKVVASLVTLGIPGYLFTYPIVSALAANGMLLSLMTVPAALYALAHLGLVLTPFMTAGTPRFLRRVPGQAMVGVGALTVLAATMGYAGGWTGVGLGTLVSLGGWGLMRASERSGEGGSLGHFAQIGAFLGAMGALMGSGALMTGMTGGLSTAILAGSFLTTPLLTLHLPWRRFIPAVASAVPVFFMGLPLASMGILVLSLAVTLSSFSVASLLFMKRGTSKIRRALPPLFMGLSAAAAYFLGLSTPAAILTLLGAVGVWRLTMGKENVEAKDRGRDLLDTEEAVTTYFPALALVTTAWMHTLGIEGTIPTLITWASYLASAFLLARIHKTIQGALVSLARGAGRSMAGFHEALDYWREGTKFVSRFRSYSREMMRGSYWNAAWLWLPWTLIGAKTLLDFASTLVLGLAGAALRSPLLVAWGASQAMGWVKPTVWLSTFVRTTEEELEGSSETTYAPWVSGRLKKAADEGGFFASVGATLAMSLLALPVWPLRLLARTIGALRRALEAAGRDAGTVKEPRSEDKLIR